MEQELRELQVCIKLDFSNYDVWFIRAVTAFVKTAKPENKDKIKSIMIAAGFASF